MFFTFVSEDYITDFVSQSEDSNLWIYKIEKNYKLSLLEKTEDFNGLKLHHVSMWNNVFYKEWNLTIDDQYNIHLDKWVYFFDINDISTQYSVVFQWYLVKNLWPWAFIINTTDEKKKSVFSLSSKLNINFLDIETSESLAQIDLFPNMYLLAFPRYNKAIKNADLWKIITSHNLNMLSLPIYSIDESNILPWENNLSENISPDLNIDLKKYLFYNNSDYDNFINNIFNFRNQQISKKQFEYTQLSKNEFYLFPWEKYILKYYEYFLNDEKRKYYYKNIILKELIQLLNDKNNSQKRIENITNKVQDLKKLDINEYDNMISHILYYYDNIIYSQKKNPDTVTNISILKEKLITQGYKEHQPSLLQLRYIYDEYHNGNIQTFHKEMNSFVSNYEKEMNLSVYNENHKIHNYFLYFLKNIFVWDFSKVKDHNQMVILFKKYIEINEIFIEQWDKIIKKTALFDNAALIKVFIDIMKISFFQEERNQKLLVLQKPAKITQNNYEILKINLQLLLNFQKNHKYLITDTGNRKDVILALAYLKYNKELNEYFEALNDYNRYELNRSEIVIELPDIIDENQLTKEKAQNYLKQFSWVNSPNTLITIRNFSYCLSNDKSKIIAWDEYCYEIKNFYVKWFKFNFFLTPFDKNRITFLNYLDDKNQPHNENIEHIMDNIETGLDRLFENAKVADRDKYDFSRFFINKYVNVWTEEQKDDNIEKDMNPFPIPNIWDESIAEKDLKLKLLTKNSPLEKIRTILPITYKYIKIIEENAEFIGKIYPTTFRLNISNNNKSDNYSWIFEWKYIFKWNNHSFKESKIYIEDEKWREKYSYFLDTQAINIQWTYLLSDTKNILEQILVNFNRIKWIYSDLRQKYEINDIEIIYNLDQKIIQFKVLNIFIYNIKDNWAMDIYKNSSKIYTWRFNTIREFLNTLQ
jgi:hypothetical protein